MNYDGPEFNLEKLNSVARFHACIQQFSKVFTCRLLAAAAAAAMQLDSEYIFNE